MKAWLFAEARTGIPRIVQGVMVPLAVLVSIGLAEVGQWLYDLVSTSGRCP